MDCDRAGFFRLLELCEGDLEGGVLSLEAPASDDEGRVELRVSVVTVKELDRPAVISLRGRLLGCADETDRFGVPPPLAVDRSLEGAEARRDDCDLEGACRGVNDEDEACRLEETVRCGCFGALFFPFLGFATVAQSSSS